MRNFESVESRVHDLPCPALRGRVRARKKRTFRLFLYLCFCVIRFFKKNVARALDTRFHVVRDLR